jgi:hypothetical protein
MVVVEVGAASEEQSRGRRARSEGKESRGKGRAS